jgi:hypothetical protein
LTDDKERRLSDVGFDFNGMTEEHLKRLKDKCEDKWRNNYSKLAAFNEEHGHCAVPRRLDKQLAEWVKRQVRHGLQIMQSIFI